MESQFFPHWIEQLTCSSCHLDKVERDPDCQYVLMERMLEGHLPNVPIVDNVEDVVGKNWLGEIDGVCAGFPCQALVDFLF